MTNYRQNVVPLQEAQQKKKAKEITKFRLAKYIPLPTLQDRYPQNTLLSKLYSLWHAVIEEQGYLYINFTSLEGKDWFVENCSIQYCSQNKTDIQITDTVLAKDLIAIPEQLNLELTLLIFMIPNTISVTDLHSVRLSSAQGEEFFHKFILTLVVEEPEESVNTKIGGVPQLKVVPCENSPKKEISREAALQGLAELEEDFLLLAQAIVDRNKIDPTRFMNPHDPGVADYMSKRQESSRILSQLNPFPTLNRLNPNNRIIGSIKEIWKPSAQGLFIWFTSPESKRWFLEHCSMQFQISNRDGIVSTPAKGMDCIRFKEEILTSKTGVFFSIPDHDTFIKSQSVFFQSTDNQDFLYSFNNPLDEEEVQP